MSFSVKDTGIGIAPEDQERIFDPFALVKEEHAQQGTGLGLSISRQYVDLMGGRLEVQSEARVGSTFSFEIPVTAGNELDISAVAKKVVGIVPGQSAEDGNPFRLLVVEDVKASRDLLVELLRPFGFDVREASNGGEAVAVWEKWRPHLIFMDQRMPIMGGLDATRIIKDAPDGAGTVIVMATASAFEEDRKAALAHGCDDFISKPVNENQVFSVLHRHLGLQFIYQSVLVVEPKADKIALDKEQLALLPEKWKNQMRQAILEADVEGAQELIREIDESFPLIGEFFSNKLYNFDYDGMRESLE